MTKSYRCRYKILLCLVLILHAAFMIALYEPACTGADANGYLAQTQYLTNTGLTTYLAESPLQFSGPHWLQLDDGRRASRYPPGLPLIYTPFYWIGGAPLMLAVNPMLTTMALLGLYALCTVWFGELWAFLAALVMAANPVANVWTFQCDSHPAIAFFLIWGIAILALWTKHNKPLYAFGAGLIWGIIPTLHYAEAVFAPAVAVYLIMHWKKNRRYYLSLGLAVFGAMIPLTLLALYHYLTFGAIAKTGYTGNDNVALFSLWFFLQKLFVYPVLLIVAGLGPFAALGIWGMVKMLRHYDARKQGILLFLLIIPLTVLYTAYFFMDFSLRFLLPTFYLYVAASMQLFKDWTVRNPIRVKRTLQILWTANTVIGLAATLFFTIPGQHVNRQLAKIVHALDEDIEAGSIVIAPMIIHQYLEALGKWQLAEESFFTGKSLMPPSPEHGNSGPGHGMPSKEMRALFQFDIHEQKMQRYRNQDGSGLSSTLLRDLDQWRQPDHSIYWIGAKENILPLIPESDHAEIITQISIDSPPPAPPDHPNKHRKPDAGGPMGMLPGMDGKSGIVIVKWKRNLL